MKKKTILLSLFIILSSSLLFASTIVIDNLSKSKVGDFPYLWKTWPFQRGDAEKVYKVEQDEGGKFIKAYDAKDYSQQIMRNFHWPIEDENKKKPFLSWKWKATKLPENAAENDGARNDSACGVYVIIGRYSGHAIKYVWSTTLPPDTVISRRDGKLKMIVLDSGEGKVGKWVSHKRDVVKDYKRLFKKDLNKNPTGIALLTDGNAVHKPAGCDYKDFAISSN